MRERQGGTALTEAVHGRAHARQPWRPPGQRKRPEGPHLWTTSWAARSEAQRAPWWGGEHGKSMMRVVVAVFTTENERERQGAREWKRASEGGGKRAPGLFSSPARRRGTGVGMRSTRGARCLRAVSHHGWPILNRQRLIQAHLELQ
jgi:hypothetical protein